MLTWLLVLETQEHNIATTAGQAWYYRHMAHQTQWVNDEDLSLHELRILNGLIRLTVIFIHVMRF